MENMAQDAPAQGSAAHGNLVSESNSGTAPQTSQPSQSGERSYRQVEVDNIVKRARHDALESYKRLASEQPDYLAQRLEPKGNEVTNSEDVVRRIAAEEANKQRDQWLANARQQAEEQEGQRIANEFLTKLNSGFEKHPDLKQKMEKMDLSRYGYAVQLANTVDNTADVWNHLVNDPFKLATINSLAQQDPGFAQMHLQTLSQSLKDNDKAANTRLPNDPIPPLRPANAGADNGALSFKDLRRKYRG